MAINKSMSIIVVSMVLIWSGCTVASYPILKIEGVSTTSSSGNRVDTYGKVNEYKHLSSTGDDLFSVAGSSSATIEMKVFDSKGRTVGSAPSVVYCSVMTIKDNMKMFVASQTTSTIHQVLNMQKDTSSGLYTLTQGGYIDMGRYGECAIDEPTGNYIVFASNNSTYRIDSTTLEVVGSVMYNVTVESLDIVKIDDMYLICKSSVEVQFIDPINLEIIVSKPFDENFLAYQLDNMNKNYMYILTSGNLISKYDIMTNTADMILLNSLDLSGDSGPNRMHNLGQHQYLFYVTVNVYPVNVLLINKKTLLKYVQSTFSLPELGLMIEKLTTTKNMMIIDDTFVFGVITKSSTQTTPIEYFHHLYSILIDRCLTRDIKTNTCLVCQQETYRNTILPGSKCLKKEEIPQGYGVESEGSYILKCADRFCTSCIDNYGECNKCQSLRAFIDGSCVPQDGYGIDPSGNLSPCNNKNCQTCRDDISKCTLCDASRAYVLSNNTCIMHIYYTTSQSNRTAPGVDISFTLTSSQKISNIHNYMKATRGIYQITIYKSDSRGNNRIKSRDTRYSTTTGRRNESAIVLDISLDYTSITEGYYVVEIGLEEGEEEKRVSINESEYILRVYKGESSARSFYREKGGIPSVMRWVSGIWTTAVNGSSPIVFCTTGALMIFDPQGGVFKITKVFQIANRLYFINIDYGMVQGEFLKSIAIVDVDEPDLGHPQYVYNVRSYRGKLSGIKITLDVISYMRYKIIMYYISWGLKLAQLDLMRSDKLARILIYFCFFWNKIHLIVFNLLLVDFLWLAPRTILHSANLGFFKMFMTYLTMIMINIDLWYICVHLLDSKIWDKAYKHYTNLRTLRKSIEANNEKKDAKQGEDDHEHQPRVTNSPVRISTARRTPLTLKQVEEEEREVDYPKTYEGIYFNPHMMNVATSSMRRNPQVYRSLTCRLLSISIWVRLPLIQLSILSCQNSPTLCLLTIGMIEVAMISCTLYAHLKYVQMKIVCLFSVVMSQSILILLFVLNSLLLMYVSNDSIVLQYIGVYTIVSACCIEMALFILYILIEVYYFIGITIYMHRHKYYVPSIIIVHEKVNELGDRDGRSNRISRHDDNANRADQSSQSRIEVENKDSDSVFNYDMKSDSIGLSSHGNKDIVDNSKAMDGESMMDIINENIGKDSVTINERINRRNSPLNKRKTNIVHSSGNNMLGPTGGIGVYRRRTSTKLIRPLNNRSFVIS